MNLETKPEIYYFCPNLTDRGCDMVSKVRVEILNWHTNWRRINLFYPNISDICNRR